MTRFGLLMRAAVVAVLFAGVAGCGGNQTPAVFVPAAGAGTAPGLATRARFAARPDGSDLSFRYIAVNGDAGDPPIGMTNGPDGNVWMTGLNLKANVERDAITYIVTGTVDFGRYHQHETPVFVSGSTYQSRGIASDGTNIWYGANGTTDAAGSYLAEMSTSFAPVASYLVPGGSTITAVAEGPSNSIWFSACDGTAGTEVGTVSNGALVLYPVTNTTNCLEDLTLGPDGELWYITTSSPYIVGKISTTGTVTTYKLPASYDKGVLGLSDLVSANGAMWESLPELKAIAEITTGGTFSLFTQPAGETSGPSFMAVDGTTISAAGEGTGTRATGFGTLTYFDTTTGTFAKPLALESTDEASGPHYSPMVYNNNYLWFGTFDGANNTNGVGVYEHAPT